MITLSPRLAAVAAHVLDGRPLADIGTDHAFLPVHLVQSGRIPRAIAGDILPGPLAAARATVEAAGLGSRIELRLGSGLRILKPGEVECATICGMGGPLIAAILAEGPLEGIRRLVLQPMSGEARLRCWLAESGWRLVDEELVQEGERLYVILVAEPGEMTLSEVDLAAGPILRRRGGPLFTRYIEAQLELVRRALEGARLSRRPEAAERAEELSHRIRLLEEALRREGQ